MSVGVEDATAFPSQWSVTSSPNHEGGINQLNGVSCPTKKVCIAVGAWFSAGAGLPQTLIESWNGTKWSVMSSPDPSNESYLNAVSCTSSSDCVAVGGYVDSSGDSGSLIESWHGESWSVALQDAGSSDPSLNGVSCVLGSQNCVAVGLSDNSSGLTTLVESWNGSTWSTVQSPSPTGDDSLDAVSCTSDTGCMAVGTSQQSTLAEAWNGTAWTVVPTPNKAYGGMFSDLACTGSADCIAVGWYGTPQVTTNLLIESWNGTTWRDAKYPDPGANGGDEAFNGVSCTSSDNCVTVGFDGTNSPVDSGSLLIESWNGSVWSVTNPGSTSAAASLSMVACPNSKLCVAVGYTTKHGIPHTTLIDTGNTPS